MTFVSEAAERMLGYAPAQWLQQDFWESKLHPEDRHRVVASCRESAAALRTNTLEYRMIAGDGRVVWLRDHVTVVGEHGEPRTLRGIVVDITDERRAHEERAEHIHFLEVKDRVNRAIQSNQDLDAMMREVLDVVLVAFAADRAWLGQPCDPDGGRWICEMERTRPEYPGAGARGEPVPIAGDVRDLFLAVCRAEVPVAFGRGAPQPVPGFLADGYQVQAVLAMTVRPHEAPPYMFGLHQCSHDRCWTPAEVRLFEAVGHRLSDALSLLHLHRRLRDSEARFRVLVDHATDAIFLHAADGTVIDANRQGCVSLGLPRETLIGMSPHDFDAGPSVQTTPGCVTDRLNAGETITLDTLHRRADGSTFPVEVRIRPFYENGKRYSVSMARDTTERRRLEQQFLQAQKMEAVGRLAGGLAHDFNNLLTVVNGCSELIVARLAAGDASRPLAQEILHAGERAAQLTRQLLAFSRRQVLHPGVVDLDRCLADLGGLLRRLLGEHIELRLDGCCSGGSARVDPVQFEQAIVNLAVNARDAMPDGGALTISTRMVTVGSGASAALGGLLPGRYVVVAVQDGGVGMDAGTRARIFEPFFSTKPAGKGTGLGLAMVYGFVRQSGGHVEVHSEPGCGAVFELYLPETDGEVQLPRPQGHAARTARGTETVLLVEDDLAVRSLTRTLLAEQGYRVLEAHDGEDGLRVARRHTGPIDLLITDLVMPHLGGWRRCWRASGRSCACC
ncbi:MAG: PAS domain S-box protein [Planctomycetes bacterium]|nr:PAS domain S-box protein [Planctomycetota bacterium]